MARDSADAEEEDRLGRPLQPDTVWCDGHSKTCSGLSLQRLTGLIPTAVLKPKLRKNDQFEIRQDVKKAQLTSCTFRELFSSARI